MNEIILSEQKQVLRVRFYDEWCFVLSDVVAVLTDSVNLSKYHIDEGLTKELKVLS